MIDVMLMSHFMTYVTIICNVTSFYFYLFLNQQFITWHTVVDRGSYFVTTYKRSELHREKETEERERERKKRWRTNRRD